MNNRTRAMVCGLVTMVGACDGAGGLLIATPTDAGDVCPKIDGGNTEDAGPELCPDASPGEGT